MFLINFKYTYHFINSKIKALGFLIYKQLFFFYKILNKENYSQNFIFLKHSNFEYIKKFFFSCLKILFEMHKNLEYVSRVTFLFFFKNKSKCKVTDHFRKNV